MITNIVEARISGSIDPALADLVERLTARLHAGEQVDDEAVLAEHPEHAERLRGLLPALRLVAGLSDAGREAVGDSIQEPLAGTLGDFRLLREVGRGGMGVVYEAQQLSLRRRVALKVLPLASTLDPRQLQRFHNEAQAAACLHHTNIVPVYSVGCERGVHYYAMQFIEGTNLASLISRLRGQAGGEVVAPQPVKTVDAAAGEPVEPAPTGVDTPPMAHRSTERPAKSHEHYRMVARLGIEAASALDHAHQHGIIHRDVKPANLMVDGAGQLWITDFGLAQMQSDTRLTMTGDLVGTLRYMSPEQALAKRVVVDHRTDVYSLGATLYELLTLQAAFTGSDRQELLRQIAFEEPKPPRRVNRTIPAELNTIVLKALEKNPAERYATAQELADDLRHWLEDRPIKARRPTMLQIANKWVRRHKGLAWTAAVFAVAAVVLLAVSTAWVWYEKGQKETALASALKAAEGEKQARQRARSALDEMSSAVIEDWLSRQRELTPEQRNFLERSLAAYEEFARDTGQDEAARAAVADAYERVGSIRQRLGQRENAEEAFRRAHDQYALLAVADPSSVKYRSGMAASLQNLVELLLKTGRPKEAESVNHDALAIWKQLADDFPNALEVRKSFASGQNNLGALLYDIGKWEEAQIAYSEALRQFQQLVKHAPADTGYRAGLAGTYMNLGVLLNRMGDTKGALVAYGKTLSLYQRLRSDFPKERLYEEWLANTQHNLGILLMQTNQPQRAEAAFHEALAIQKRLTNDFPTVAAYQYELAESLYQMGNLLKNTGQQQQAEERYNQALTIQKRLVADFPIASDYRKTLARSQCNLGFFLATTGRLNEVEAHFQSALAHLQQLASDFPADHGIRLQLADAHNNLGELLRRIGRPGEAVTAYRKAIEVRPNFPEAYSNLGLALGALKTFSEAEKALHRAIELRPDFADFHYNLGLSLVEQGKLEPAESALRECIRLNADDAEAYCKLGFVLLQRGKFQEAVEKLRRGNKLGSQRPAWQKRYAEQLRSAETIAALDARLPALLNGKEQPKDSRERLALAQLCQQQKQLFAAAARWYGEAFASDSKLAADLNAQHRYNAACAAALAGCGQGKDADKLDLKDRSRLRQRALNWMRDDLKAYGDLIHKTPGTVGPAVQKQMQHWLTDNDFEGVRGAESLAKLSEEECTDWRKLWKEVEGLRQRAAQRSKIASPVRP